MKNKNKEIPSDFVEEELLHDPKNRTVMHQVAFRKDMKDAYKKFIQNKMKK